MYKIAAVVLCLLLWLPRVQAQSQPDTAPQPKIILRVHTTSEDAPRLRGYTFSSTHPDSVEASKAVKELIYQMQQDAYLLTSADSLYLRNDTLHVKLFIGDRFEYASLRNGNLSEGIL